MGYGSKHVRFSAERPVVKGRNQHFTRHGRPKIRYESLDDAQYVVLSMRAEDKDVQAYLCKECDGYHVGNRRHVEVVPDRDIAMFCELGPRAYAHMRTQNSQRRKRLRIVMGLIKVAQDKRLWGVHTNPASHRKR